MNRRDLEFQLQDLFEGRLEGAEFEALEQELRHDPDARRLYREYLHLHHALRFRGIGVDLLKVIPMDRVIERQQRRNLRTAGLAAAAILVLGALLMTLILTRTAPPALTFTASPGTEFITSHVLTDKEAPEGQALEPGSRLEVRSGTVELEFASEVRAVVRGPAKLYLERDDLLDLGSGTAWFHVPAKAVGFKVSTPDLIVTDLGTEFGVVSSRNFPDEVHVFTGKVEVHDREGARAQQRLEANQARAIDPAGQWRTIPVRPEPFLTELPTREPESAVIVTEVSSNQEFGFADDVSSSDLLNGLVPSASGWNLNNDASPSELTDGIHGTDLDEVPGDRVQGAWTQVGASAEFHLGKGTDGSGYDITSMQSIAAWRGEGFANQCWSISVKPVDGSYRKLAEVSFAPFKTQNLRGGGSTKVTLTDQSGVLARRIESIRVVAGRVPASVDNAYVWREFDVFGKPSGR